MNEEIPSLSQICYSSDTRDRIEERLDYFKERTIPWNSLLLYDFLVGIKLNHPPFLVEFDYKCIHVLNYPNSRECEEWVEYGNTISMRDKLQCYALPLYSRVSEILWRGGILCHPFMHPENDSEIIGLCKLDISRYFSLVDYVKNVTPHKCSKKNYIKVIGEQ